MKKLFIVGLILALFALDWAALDDITTGSEPNYFLEYAVLLASLGIFGFVGFTFARNKRLRNGS